MGPGRQWIKSLVFLIFCLAGPAGVSLSTEARMPDPSGIFFRIPSRAEPLSLPAWPYRGTLFISLKAAVEYLGGTVSWQNTIHQAIVKGPNGRQVALTLGYPKIVVNKQKLLRLPHVPRFIQGKVLVSIQSLVVIWKEAGNSTASYDPATRSFSLAVRPALIEDKRSQTIALPPAGATAGRHGVIIVDAGHGGKDPGAIGPSQLQEKAVTLEIAQQLAPLLEARGFKVILTRKDDTFISLPRRAELAHRTKADLFVSIHANASRNRKACGSNIYIYNREASSKNAAETARLENMDVNYLEIIKDDLRQSIHEEASITAGGLVGQAFGKIGSSIRQLERAPFYVLAKSHMPSILVETAFISNTEEEEKLRSLAFCRRLAEIISEGVDQYFLEKIPASQGKKAAVPKTRVKCSFVLLVTFIGQAKDKKV